MNITDRINKSPIYWTDEYGEMKNPDAKVVEIIGCAHCGKALIATEDKENYLVCATDFTEPHMFGPEAERLGIYVPQGDEHIVPLSYEDTKITIISCANCGETVLLCDEKKMGEDNFMPIKNFSYNNSIYSVVGDRVFHVLDHWIVGTSEVLQPPKPKKEKKGFFGLFK